MKKNYIFKFILLLIPVLAFTLLSFSSGNPNAFSGSPGDSGNNCTQCHSGTANNSNITIHEVNNYIYNILRFRIIDRVLQLSEIVENYNYEKEFINYLDILHNLQS